jgi:bacterioferritin
MQGDADIITALNRVLTNELTAVNQFFLHSRMLKHWGLNKLGDHEYEESIEEMKHADRLIERILFLGGLPNLQDLDKLLVGEDVRELLECDLKLEQKAAADLKDGIATSEARRDFVTRDLFVELLRDEEGHIDYIETQLDLIERIGIQNYAQSQI